MTPRETPCPVSQPWDPVRPWTHSHPGGPGRGRTPSSGPAPFPAALSSRGSQLSWGVTVHSPWTVPGSEPLSGAPACHSIVSSPSPSSPRRGRQGRPRSHAVFVSDVPAARKSHLTLETSEPHLVLLPVSQPVFTPLVSRVAPPRTSAARTIDAAPTELPSPGWTPAPGRSPNRLLLFRPCPT